MLVGYVPLSKGRNLSICGFGYPQGVLDLILCGYQRAVVRECLSTNAHCCYKENSRRAQLKTPENGYLWFYESKEGAEGIKAGDEPEILLRKLLNIVLTFEPCKCLVYLKS